MKKMQKIFDCFLDFKMVKYIVAKYISINDTRKMYRKMYRKQFTAGEDNVVCFLSIEHTKAKFNVRAFTANFKIPYVKEVLYVRGRAACINSAALSLLNITTQSQSSIHQKK